MSNEIDDDKKPLPRSSKELRILYGVSGVTWWRYLRSANLPKHIKIFTPNELEILINHLGRP
jgi:hypothetical protein